jgi:hypothetical protein
MRRRPAFSLIEVVVSVLMLSLAVPPVLEMVSLAGADRADTVNTNRAVVLATLVLESVVADIASGEPTLGFDALADPASYLNAPATGLSDRLAGVSQPYLAVGMAWTLDIGPLVGPQGVADTDPAGNLFRTVTVRVTYPSASGGGLVLPVSVMVGGL